MVKRIPPKKRDQATLQELGESVMDVVTKVAGRRLTLILEMIQEEYIAPRDQRIAELETQVRQLGGTV